MTMVHIEIALGPVGIDGSCHVPRRIGVKTMEIGVQIWHGALFETKVQGKHRSGVGDALDARLVGLGENAPVDEFDQLFRVDVGDDQIGIENAAFGSNHTRGFLAFHKHLGDFTAGQDAAFVLGQHRTQGLGNGVATAHYTISSFVIKVEDESVGRERGFAFLRCI